MDAGEAIRSVTEPGALLVTVEYVDGGANSPMLLYFARRQGWSFDVRSITAAEVAFLRATHRARYFATADWADLEAGKPDVATFLTTTFKEVALPSATSGARVFDLAASR